MRQFDSFQDFLSQIQTKTSMFNYFWQPFWVDNIGSHLEIWLQLFPIVNNNKLMQFLNNNATFWLIPRLAKPNSNQNRRLMDFDSCLELSILVAILNYFRKHSSANEFIGNLNLLFDKLHDFLAVKQDEIFSFTQIIHHFVRHLGKIVAVIKVKIFVFWVVLIIIHNSWKFGANWLNRSGVISF